MPDPAQDAIARSLKQLTIIGWLIVVFLAINLALSISAQLRMCRIFMSGAEPGGVSRSQSSVTFSDPYEGFYDWPIEKQIESSSVIAVGKFEKKDSRLKCVITEILKQKPGTTFYYKVGDEYMQGSRFMERDTEYGDGQIMFFVDSPASFRFSTSYSDDRIHGLGDMPIQELRKLIQKHQ